MKKAFTPAKFFSGLSCGNRKSAFTLAEVLITLGIIGVVAAMTLPVLTQKNNNRVVETRLMKFYSAINQAVKMAELDYGDKQYWWNDLAGAQLDDEGNPIEGTSEAESWFNKYLKPYMKIIKQETLSDGTFIVYFPDGSALRLLQQATTRDWLFYPGTPEKCIKQYGTNDKNANGICSFAFNFRPIDNGDNKWIYHINKGIEPFKHNWDGSYEKLYSAGDYGCKNGNRRYCTAIIQYNGWKIPEDYPYKVSY